MSAWEAGQDAAGASRPPEERRPRTAAADSSASWRRRDRAGLALAWTFGLLFCAICFAIVIFMLIQGIRFVRPELLWTNPKVGSTQNETGGILAPILGSLIVCTIGLLLAAPMGIAVAVWLSEYARPAGLARIVESTIEMLAGAPSVALALFGILLFDSRFLGFLSSTNAGVVYGKSFFAAGAMLSLIALPYIVAAVREGLTQIPDHVREASYALGKTKVATIRRVLLPAARPSVITGNMLGLGHMLGDTAIIVFLLGDTYTLQSAGHIPFLSILQGTGSTLTSFIFDNAPTGELNQPNKAYAAAFVLLIMILVLNLVVDIFGRRTRELKWN